MRIGPIAFLGMAIVSVSACSHKEADRRRDSPAFEAGVVAHEVARQSAKAVQAAGRELAKGAKEADKGWNAAARDDREKKKR